LRRVGPGSFRIRGNAPIPLSGFRLSQQLNNGPQPWNRSGRPAPPPVQEALGRQTLVAASWRPPANGRFRFSTEAFLPDVCTAATFMAGFFFAMM